MFDTVRADLRYALRWLYRSPGFTLVAIASLAIGIGFNTALFTLVDAILFRPLPVERPDRLVEVYTSSRTGNRYATTSYPDFQDLKKQNTVFSDMLGYSLSLDAVGLEQGSRSALGEVVTGNYFQMLGIKPAIGRTLLPEDDRRGAPRVVVISHKLWTREYGASPDVLTRFLRIHGQPYAIVGVAPRAFTGMIPIVSSEMWTTMAYVEEVQPGGIIDTVPSPGGTDHLDRRGQRWMFIKGRLKDGETVERAGANLQVLMQQLVSQYPDTNKDRRITVMPTNRVHIHPEADGTLLSIAAGLMLVVGLVLLVACANVASMLLARASGRQREIGIRLAIGATRGRLVQQLLTESVVMAFLGALGGLTLAWALTRAATSIELPIPIPLTFTLGIDQRVLVFTSVVTMIAGLVAGLAPALKATKPSLVAELKGDVNAGKAAGRRWTLRDGLVAVQIAVTLVLLVAAGLLGRSLMAAERMGIGFRPEGLALVSTELDLIGYSDDRGKQFFEQALARIRAIPGVEAAGIAERTPFSINYNHNVIFLPERQGPVDKGFEVDVTTVSGDYFETIGVPLLQGRIFNNADTPTSPRVAIINETMAKKYWPGENALGKRFRIRTFDGPFCEIVGITADHKVSTIGEPPTPYVHFAYSQRPSNGEAILARTRGNAGQLVGDMRKALLALEPNVVFLDSQTMEAQVGATLLPARFGAMSVSAVGIVAMLLAAIGLYGVISYSVARRTREIGIRMAIGAQPSAVLGLVLKQGLGLAGVGVAVGALFAVAAAKAVSGALYGISFLDPVAWSTALAVLVSVSVLANGVPALRAARVDPSRALRSE